MTKLPWFSVTKVHPLVYAIRENNHWEDVISYLLIGSHTAYLIDTGMGYRSIKKVVSSITSLPIVVLLTHAHWDHIGCVDEFNDVHIFDAPFERESLETGFLSLDIHELQDAFFLNDFVARSYQAKGTKTYKTFQDTSMFEDPEFTVTVLHTPGHTPGSVCFWVPEFQLLFTGDTLYPGPEYIFMKESNLLDYKKSIAKLVEICLKEGKSDFTIFPGHNSVLEKQSLLRLHHQALEGRLKPLAIQNDNNSYGTFTQHVYEKFELLVPLDSKIVQQ